MPKASKIRASKQSYQSPGQLFLEGFETPFEQHLSSKNRWVKLARLIPWDELVGLYEKQMRNSATGASNINPRVVLGAVMIKHMCNLSDEETILQIQENMYMQYFIGYSSYTSEPAFDPSLFVEIRKRLGLEQIAAINEKIYQLSVSKERDKHDPPDTPSFLQDSITAPEDPIQDPSPEGRLLVDATVSPQDIAFPTDLNILNDCREKSEELIDSLYKPEYHGEVKPRTYRRKARKIYLKTAQKKSKSRNAIRNAIGKQLRFLRRNINHIHWLLDAYTRIPLDKKQYKYLLVIQEAYRQQTKMYDEQTHSVEHRIVSIHQPHVRPIVRGKEKARVEFGAKINISLVKGYSFIDHFRWEAYNEGQLLMDSVEQYKQRHGFYPKEVLADQIYCNRQNRMQLKLLGIRLLAKPLGRPSAVNREHVSPGERNPIEGKFGQAKNAYGLDRIRARLMDTSQSWIASIIMVLNLVKLAGQVPIAIIEKIVSSLFQCTAYRAAA